MADAPSGLAGLADPSRREVAAVVAVVLLVAGSHLVAPAVVPGYAVYTQYAAYLVAFSVWMAWFVDWLAVWLGQDPHPAEADGADHGSSDDGDVVGPDDGRP